MTAPGRVVLSSATDTLGRMATGRYIVLLFAAFVLFNVAVFPTAAARIDPRGQGLAPLDLRFGYSPATAHAVLTAYGEDGRRAYLFTELTADVVYPIVYAFLFSLMAVYASERLTRLSGAMRVAAFLPFTALVSDYVENAAIVTLLVRYPEPSDTLVHVASAVTRVKWVLFTATIVVVAGGFGAVAMTRRGRHAGR